MSAREPATPEELVNEFPITAEEAQAIADAMTPVQNFSDVGASLGNTFEEVPASGPRFLGVILRNLSTQVNLASQNAEVIARAIDFYVTTQTESLEAAFPPPEEIARIIREDFRPLRELASEQFPPEGPPFQPPE